VQINLSFLAPISLHIKYKKQGRVCTHTISKKFLRCNKVYPLKRISKNIKGFKEKSVVSSLYSIVRIITISKDKKERSKLKKEAKGEKRTM